MALKTYITDGQQSEGIAHLHKSFTDEKVFTNGLVVYSEPRRIWKPKNQALANATYGVNMNINASVGTGGATELVHNGVSDGETLFNFDSNANPSVGSYHVRYSAGVDGEATFTDAGTTDIANFTSLTGQIYLTAFSSQSHITITLKNSAGTNLASANLEDFIDIGNLGTYQNFSIPLHTSVGFNLPVGTVKSMTMLVTKTGSVNPSFDLDQLQFVASGGAGVGSQTFTMTPSRGRITKIENINVIIADVYTGITTVAGATENATLQNLSYNKILGVTELANGINFQIQSRGVLDFQGNIKNMADFLTLPRSNITFLGGDGTNAFVTIRYDFPTPIVLEPKYEDYFSVTLSDDLSGLSEFKILTGTLIEIEDPAHYPHLENF